MMLWLHKVKNKTKQAKSRASKNKTQSAEQLINIESAAAVTLPESNVRLDMEAGACAWKGWLCRKRGYLT